MITKTKTKSKPKHIIQVILRTPNLLLKKDKQIK